VTEDPSESTFKTYEESGTDLGQALITKKKLSDVKGAMPAEMAKALGKLSGGLYVVTAAQGTARSGMIASWVSQASFEPLGFTIAVAKDRAIESLMQVGRCTRPAPSVTPGSVERWQSDQVVAPRFSNAARRL
jgi:hypothetical protein